MSKHKTTPLVFLYTLKLASICCTRYRHSFICQGTATRRQRSDLFGL